MCIERFLCFIRCSVQCQIWSCLVLFRIVFVCVLKLQKFKEIAFSESGTRTKIKRNDNRWQNSMVPSIPQCLHLNTRTRQTHRRHICVILCNIWTEQLILNLSRDKWVGTTMGTHNVLERRRTWCSALLVLVSFRCRDNGVANIDSCITW